MGIDEWEPRLGIFTIRGLGPANDNLMSQGDDPGSSEAPLPIRNESRETRADRIVIMHCRAQNDVPLVSRLTNIGMTADSRSTS